MENIVNEKRRGMNFIIKMMNVDLARKILSWQYEEPYNFYNNEVNEEGINEFLSGSYQAITDDKGKLFGFLCTGEAAQVPAGNKYGVYHNSFIDIGLGMHPDYTGKGYGYEFMLFIIKYVKGNYIGIPMRLTVATFNKRAIHLYEKMGFVKLEKFTTDYAEFITMIKRN